MAVPAPLIISQFGLWSFTTLGVFDLIAATTNAFNGALLARRPDHYKHFTVVGIIALAYVGGIGGGIIRDILVNKVPSPLLNPWYLIACLAAAALALLIDYGSGQRFKDGLFQLMTAFSLPWYAIVGAETAMAAHLGYFAAVLIGALATTGGRFIIDIACGVIPKQTRSRPVLRWHSAAHGSGVSSLRVRDRVIAHIGNDDRILGRVWFPSCRADVRLGRVGTVGARTARNRRGAEEDAGRGFARRARLCKHCETPVNAAGSCRSYASP